jgi:hypothetical protein
MPYYAVKGINEDSYGYDYISYVWRGAKEIGPNRYELIELAGEDAIKAHLEAINSRIIVQEDATMTGGIAVPVGGYSPCTIIAPESKTVALGTERSDVTRKLKKGKEVIFGGKPNQK